MTTKQLNELATETLSKDSDIYKQIYDLLEEHTFTPVIDAWVKLPNPNNVKIEQLPAKSTQKVLAWADKHQLNRDKALKTLEGYRNSVILHVNDKSVVVTREIAAQIKTWKI